ncbi:FecR family protein [Dokdonia sp.]|uniref:FecR family protein n=1 Tax=Dokdonia sp. TaxID=2024995 RepID=UPI003262DA09
MEKEYLYKKWLNDELTPSELEAFRELDDAALSQEIIQEAKRFNASEQYLVDDFEVFNSRKDKDSTIPTKVIRFNWIQKLSGVAALFVIILGAYYAITAQSTTTITTQLAQKETVHLPDQSQVTLNAITSLTYAKDTWDTKREVSLDGEAFFNVAKGATFDVLTDDGIVSVLGTSFNVKQRNHFFEVTCYEGLVSVSYNDKEIKLPAGTTFRLDHTIETKGTISGDGPQWIANRSVFSKVAVIEVFKELERQYDVRIDLTNIDSTILFSGGFEHSDLPNALTAITAPLRMNYNIENNRKVVIYDATH